MCVVQNARRAAVFTGVEALWCFAIDMCSFRAKPGKESIIRLAWVKRPLLTFIDEIADADVSGTTFGLDVGNERSLP